MRDYNLNVCLGKSLSVGFMYAQERKMIDNSFSVCVCVRVRVGVCDSSSIYDTEHLCSLE